ncbi:MAG: hypothetical protein KJN60_01175, partial [Boseongicola sp.]|nr:hypothetical protein [Boseongicola sp.]
EPIVRGSGVVENAVAGREKEANRACKRFIKRVLRAFQVMSLDNGVALPLPFVFFELMQKG